MSAVIRLDQDFTTFTNLDIISGQVIVRTPRPINVNAITIKLEGESRTRLLPPPTPQNNSPRAQLEFHKILYKVVSLFPPPEWVSNVPQGPMGKPSFALPAGEHVYNFSFKLPFNVSCPDVTNAAPSVSLSGMMVEISNPPTSHRRGPLPPTLRGFPGEAEIRYYLKATVVRASLLKENIRIIAPFNFCPIDPPRPATQAGEAFARKKHQFLEPFSPDIKGKRSLFSSSASKSKATINSQPQGAPFVSVEMRLPEPPILTSNQDLPLRILITSLNGRTENIALSSLQLDLAHFTHVRAHNVVRTETSGTVLLSKSNMSIPLDFRPAEDGSGNPVCELSREFWYNTPIPRTLPPSFGTCNISRIYEVIVRVGLTFGTTQGGQRPQLVVLDLRHKARLYAGIAPPPELLASVGGDNKMSVPPLPARRPVSSGAPVAGGSKTQPPPPGYSPAAQQDPYPDAPPSYEDAIADALPAVHVRDRQGYEPPPSQGGEDKMLPTDEKRGWH